MADNSVYLGLHSLSYAWPCLSFDVLRDNLGSDRSTFPHTAWIVAGTQAGDIPGQGKAKDEVVVMRLGGLSKTQHDDADSDASDDEDDQDDDEDATLDFLTIPHIGAVNRIRARTLPSQTGQPDPYHVATFSETGKVHIYDVRPYIDTLAGPSKPRQKTPLHTITNHGRNEGYAVEWGETGLLTGDIANKIYLTTVTPTGFHTSPNPYMSHTSSVEDLQWSPSENTVFASASADRTVRVWDIRAKGRKSVVSVEAHTDDVNVISWNKSVEYLLVSGGDEGGLKVWDLRMFKEYVGGSFSVQTRSTPRSRAGNPHRSLTFHGTLRRSLPSNGTRPTHPYSPRLARTTSSPSGTFPSSKTRTRRPSPPSTPTASRCKYPRSSCSSTRAKKTSRSSTGTPRSPVWSSPPPAIRSTSSRRSLVSLYKPVYSDRRRKGALMVDACVMAARYNTGGKQHLRLAR